GRDDQYQDPIAVYRGKMGGSQFQPLIVNGDTVYFRFTTGPVATFWGFKFTVTPLEWRLNDNQALQGLNFELGALPATPNTQHPTAPFAHLTSLLLLVGGWVTIHGSTYDDGYLQGI